MVQFLSINFFLGFLQFLLGFSKVPIFCVILFKNSIMVTIKITRSFSIPYTCKTLKRS